MKENLGKIPLWPRHGKRFLKTLKAQTETSSLENDLVDCQNIIKLRIFALWGIPLANSKDCEFIRKGKTAKNKEITEWDALRVNKHTKRCRNSLVMGKIHIKIQ